MDESRIMVTNFDPNRQAQLWLEQGAEEAAEVLLGMLRTAILIGGQLIIDRSQLLDGVFFLATGPDRLARELGLDDRSPLPITVNCEPGEPRSRTSRLVPRMLGRDGNADFENVSMGLQLEKVSSEGFLKTSAAIRAMIGRGEHPWLMPDPGDEWFAGAGFTDRLHPLDPDQPEVWRRTLIRARERWVEAAEKGRVVVDVWRDGMDIDPALSEQLKRLRAICSEPDPLAEEVLNFKGSVRRDVVEFIHEKGAAADVSPERQRLALGLWSRAYYQAIARKDGALLVAFDDEGLEAQAQSNDEEDRARARSFGLWSPPRSRWQLLRDRRGSVSTGLMRVEGEIHDHLKIIDPGLFRQLRRSSSDVVNALVEEGRREDMYQLALACRHVVTGPPSRRRVRLQAGLRVVTVTLLAFVVASVTLFDSFSALSGGVRAVAVTGATLLGFTASLPYSDIAEYFRTRSGSMAAVLDLQNAP